MSRLLKVAMDRMDSDQDSQKVECVALKLVPEGLVNRSDVRDMMEDTLDQLTDRLDARISRATAESLIWIIGN